MTAEGVLRTTGAIPVPQSVSAHAQAVLAAAGGMVQRGDAPNPPRDDLDAWKAHIATMERALCAAMERRNGASTTTVESITVAGVPVFDLVPDGAGTGPDAPIYLDLHGGAFIAGGGDSCRAMAIGATDRVRMHVWSPDYRMPPDHPFPASLDDCLAVYRALLEQWPAARVVVGGASAGGNLAAALLLRAREAGLPFPAALVLLSPASDLTESGDTFQTNFGIDTVLTRRVDDLIWLYARDHDLADPLISPLFGDLAWFPPTFLQSGTRDLLLSNTVRMHRKLRAAGVEADLHVFEAMPHGGFWGAPEDLEMAEELRRFLAAHVH